MVEFGTIVKELSGNQIYMGWFSKYFRHPGGVVFQGADAIYLYNGERLGSLVGLDGDNVPSVNILNEDASIKQEKMPLNNIPGLDIHRIDYGGRKINLFVFRYLSLNGQPESFQRLVLPVCIMAVSRLTRGSRPPGYYLFANMVRISKGNKFNNNFFMPMYATYASKWGEKAGELREGTIPFHLGRIVME